MQELLALVVEQSRGWFPETRRASVSVPGRVLITGAAGSIGCLLARSLCKVGLEVVALDWDEQRLYRLTQTLEGIEPVLADVHSTERWRAYLEGCQWVIHCAAYKDVPFLESQPAAAWRNNVISTEKLLNACAQHGVPNILHISTDKSVEPVSWLGLSKWASEQLVVEYMRATEANVAVLRLCNVLASRGSVLRLWAENPGQCVITDPNARRWYVHPDVVASTVLSWVAQPQKGILLSPTAVERSVGALWQFFQDCCRQLNIQAKHVALQKLRQGEKLSERLHWAFESPIRIGHFDVITPWVSEPVPAEVYPEKDEVQSCIQRWRRRNESDL
ncbi:MAG: SDR family NAD(P)-dependent oxidoreductase [Gammaproteobacteria bacterium]|nr:MAG: SDR family NAD(P)-dependent oxidoreductase [Gammaproteobacteria bacterium]